MNAELIGLGLTPFFAMQLNEAEIEQGRLARVTQVQRSLLLVSDGVDEWSVTAGRAWQALDAEQRPTVGDWLLLEPGGETIVRLLERKSVFRRVAAGAGVEVQLIAANIDTLFVVTSCNEEFNESRLERYLALAFEAGVDPVVVLSKADLAGDEAQTFSERVRALSPGIAVEAVNARDADSVGRLAGWVSEGATVALVGSSGVGKSTLVNSLAGAQVAATGAIREQDARGRHTTSYRALHPLPGGGLLLDVPGMRELKVARLGDSLAEVFADIDTLARQCRFRDCEHLEEPGCAVRAAVASGELDERRLRNYHKLVREEARHNTSLAAQRRHERRFGKVVKEAVGLKRRSEQP